MAKRGAFSLREAIDLLGLELGAWPAGANQDFSYGMLGNLNRPIRRGLLVTSRNEVGHIVWKEAL